MIQTTVKVDGMMCSMCEAHINDAVRRAFSVKKVSSSHRKGETVILSEEAPDAQKLREVIDTTGYRVLDIASAPYKKTSLFSR
ncbi:MAG: heavy-metal-associated domain-containing protein [Oscillospiraceae bacterium]|nr:heavy-metal-associated domain-containing protein [Oscillospiraceae bacterium]MBQ9250896.1 heavy-metal-associated domain-containing protein [Oscillospiraceae bacterium]